MYVFNDYYVGFVDRRNVFHDLCGFSWFPGHKVLEPVPPCAAILLPLKEDGRLQSCRFGGLDAWMPAGLEAGGLDPGSLGAGWLACWLAGLDWIGFEWLLDRRKWWDWRIPCVLTRSTL